jgi:prophage regulatory protein
MIQLINRKTLHSIIPLAERTIYDMEKRGEFPNRIVLTSRNVAWDLEEIQAWIVSRKASNDQAIFAGLTPVAA